MQRDIRNKHKKISKVQFKKLRRARWRATLIFIIRVMLVMTVLMGCVPFFVFGKELAGSSAAGPASETITSTVKTGPAQEIEKGIQEETEPVRTIPETQQETEPDSNRQEQLESTAPTELSQDGETEKQPSLIDPSKPMIAFTFDDGPYTKVDSRILNVLENYGGRATFFVVGSRVGDYKETLKRIYDSGSEIGNHTYSHKNLQKLDAGSIVSQVEATNDAVEAIIGQRPKLVRVPYGAYRGQVSDAVRYPMIQWNVDTRDWESKNKDAVLNSILSNAKDGNIILMHDLYPSTAEAFEEAIPLLIERGFQLVTVSELYASKGISLDAGNVYFNVK